MIKFFLLTALCFVNIALAQDLNLEKKIGQMLMLGFHGTSADSKSQICKDIKKYHLGAVILFDYNPVNKNKAKNISSKAQLKKLTQDLQSCASDG
ncbi:MAG: glycosyl hydrolase, partial [Epsilonproteobacteria bacterium]